MNYIDKLLPSILDNSSSINARDLKTLKSINKLIHNTIFISENQGRLLIKILKENINNIDIDPSILEEPIWSQPFRVVDKTRKLFISGNTPDELKLTVEYAFNSAVKKQLNQISGRITQGFYSNNNPKQLHTDLTEENIVILVEELTKMEFEIDSVVQDYYDTIVSWNIEDIYNQYRINTINHTNFQRQITNDLGIDTPLDSNIIADRSTRYQYYVDKNLEPHNLTELIANRNDTKVWINSNEYTIDDIVSSLIELKRIPLLFVIDTRTNGHALEELQSFHNSFVKHNINSEDVGIYFRLSNNVTNGKEFNQLIADYGYNSQLTSSTKVVGIETTKIPKFMLKNDWRPMSVIAVNHTLRHSKSAIYSNCCDLIISYTSNEPIIETRTMWE